MGWRQPAADEPCHSVPLDATMLASSAQGMMPEVAPNNGPTVSHCLGVATADKGVSIGLDILGAITAVGNAVSAGAGIVRAGIAVNHAITSPVFAVGSGVYGAYGGVTAGPEEATDASLARLLQEQVSDLHWQMCPWKARRLFLS